jgi:hypothetical protein
VIKEVINEYGRQMGRSFPDRSKTVGASEIGLCARRVAFLKRGIPSDRASSVSKHTTRPKKTRAQKQLDKRGAAQLLDGNWGAHIRGTVIEEQLWLPAMRARFGGDLIMAGGGQQTLSDGKLSATPDGIVVNRGHEILSALKVKYGSKDSKSVVVECKSIDPRVNLVEEKAENAYQVQVQMGLIRKLTPYKPDWAVISYVDASFWHEVAEFAVPFDQSAFDAAELRAAKILHADPQDHKPEGWISGGKECGYCPWMRQCAEMRGGVPLGDEPVDEQFKAEIVDMCKQANRLQVKAKADSEAFKDLQDQIKMRLKEKGIRKIPGVVNWYTVRGRDSYDVEAMLATLTKLKVDPDQFRTTGEPTNALSVDKKVALL